MKAPRTFRLIAVACWALLFGVNWHAAGFENAAYLGLLLALVFPVVAWHECWSAAHEKERASVCASYALTALLFASLDYYAFSMVTASSSFGQFDGMTLALVALLGSAVVIILQIVLFATARIHSGRAAC